MCGSSSSRGSRDRETQAFQSGNRARPAGQVEAAAVRYGGAVGANGEEGRVWEGRKTDQLVKTEGGVGGFLERLKQGFCVSPTWYSSRGGRAAAGAPLDQVPRTRLQVKYSQQDTSATISPRQSSLLDDEAARIIQQQPSQFCLGVINHRWMFIAVEFGAASSRLRHGRARCAQSGLRRHRDKRSLSLKVASWDNVRSTPT